MDVVYRCCCGIDVHKKSVSAHFLRRGVSGMGDIAETTPGQRRVRGSQIGFKVGVFPMPIRRDRVAPQ